MPTTAVRVLLCAVVSVTFGCSGRTPKVGDSCSSVSDCFSEAVELSCAGGECVRLPCDRTAECAIGAACVSGICQTPQCSSDNDCTGDQVCFEGDCRADVCMAKSECARGMVCLGVPPQCVDPPALCAADADCPNDTACKLPEATCAPPCGSDEACAAGEYCADRFCRLRCQSNGDCGVDTVCVDGRCVVSTCPEAPCPDIFPFRDPTTCLCVECLTRTDCDVLASFGCNDMRRCVYCPVETQLPQTCDAQGLRFEGGCCVECTLSVQCGEGEVCESGQCVLRDPRECVTDEHCIDDDRCVRGYCTAPASEMPCEVQADCPAGEACSGAGMCAQESDQCVDCPEPSRCVGDTGDASGTCAGCAVGCEAQGCPQGHLCVVSEGAAEGFCVSAAFSNCD